VIQVALRFDDPSASSDHNLERLIIDVLASHGCSATVAAIPFQRLGGELVALTRERIKHLIDAAKQGVIEIALHGFSHEPRGHAPHGKPSEFAGLPATEQRTLIAQGLHHLTETFGHKICGFVPPWNSFDIGTLDALDTLVFQYVSAGWEAPLSYQSNTAIIPRTCNLSNLEAAVAEARRLRFLSPVVVAVMHHYDFFENGSERAIIDLPTFDNLLGWLARQSDVALVPLFKIAAACTASDCRRGLKRYRWMQSLHWRLRPYIPRHTLLTGSPWRFL